MTVAVRPPTPESAGPETKDAAAPSPGAPPARPENVPFNRRPRIVILGGGFGGTSAAKTLRGADASVLLIDRTNHFVFQPLLYQVATAALAPSDISLPLRSMFRNQKNVDTLMGEVKGIDTEKRLVFVNDERRPIPYDYLIVTTGAKHSYFGHDAWERDAPGLKTLADAAEIRRRFLNAFEEADRAADPKTKAAYMTFVLVGGGPTGCELAGVMPEIARRSLRGEYRHINTDDVKVILIEAGPRILPTFPEDLSARAQKDLEHLGVTIRTGDPVVAIDTEGVTLKSGERIATRSVFWAAGNAASPLAKDLGAPLDRAGRVLVNPDLSVPGHPEIFVAGDLAAVTQENGKPVPAVAQGGIQGGRHAAENILHLMHRQPTTPFHFWDKGNLAVIGRNKAIADLNVVHLHGVLAWLTWVFIHILYLVGFRNRLSVLLQWAYAYFTLKRGVRIIDETEQRDLEALAQGGET